MLKHRGIASSGHWVTFPQDVNEPAQILPKLPHEINIIKLRKTEKKIILIKSFGYIGILFNMLWKC